MIGRSRRGAALRAFADASPGGTRLPVSLLDEIPVATLALRGDDVVFANRAAHRLGIVRGTFLVVTELRQTARLVRRDGVRRETQLTLPAADLSGTRIPVRAELFLLGGDETGVIVEDQTEAARVEAVRRDFVANVGHEVKTPVGAISLLAEALREARDDPETVARFVGRISTETARLSRLVQELIDLSRLQGGEPLPEMRVVDMSSVVQDVVEQLRPIADAGNITLTVVAPSGHLVLGDPPQLAAAVSNLVDNAVAYSSEGANVTVTVKDREDVVEVVVADEGAGIAHGELGRIFERFYRVDPARSRETGGTGLGLAIVKHVMHNHGGEVTVWSTPQVGSTFTLRLPAARVDEPVPQP